MIQQRCWQPGCLQFQLRAVWVPRTEDFDSGQVSRHGTEATSGMFILVKTLPQPGVLAAS